MNFMALRAESKQAQTLSPRLQHAVRLLQMSSLDFAAMVRQSMGRNPFLEGEDGEGDEEHSESAQGAGSIEEPQPFDAAEAGTNEAADLTGLTTNTDEAAFGDDRDLWSSDAADRGARAEGGHGVEGGDVSAIDLMAVPTTLTKHLHGQLNVLPLPWRDLLLCRTLVESLDDDGYLRTPLVELLGLAEADPPATLAEMRTALRRVQSLDPAGVGARNVAECLELQLPDIESISMQALARTIISEHLERLASRDVAGLARDTGQTPECIQGVCDRIRRMDPRPGWRFSASDVAYVVPDVIVRKLRGQWTVQLNPAIVPRVRMNRVYEELFQRHRNAGHSEMGDQLNEARWTLRNVAQRFSTILDVATAIVNRQQDFFEFGPMAMKPLGLKQIADEVGVHESTVSRVTNNKYMATPVGVFELKHFFSRAMPTANGGTCSSMAIRGLIQDVIAAENRDRPLSDAEIARQFAQQGLVVARRTITKYRQMLKIDAVERRRRQPAVEV